MYNLINAIKAAQKKKFFFWNKKLLEYGARLNTETLRTIQAEYGFTFPSKVRLLLLELGESSYK